ncbi:hypothetical protein EDB89DRAFT_2068589 [Lactarius sanguifluus]|nr:hypothetical protein EDB89DRAFT_2068589 [Lactarius sanguifluus]
MNARRELYEHHVPSFDPAEKSQKESADLDKFVALDNQEFQSVLRSIFKSSLSCVEGLQALDGNITEVIEGIESTATDVTIQAYSNKLDLREFVETFNELELCGAVVQSSGRARTWKRVGLPTLSSIQAFHQVRVSQFAKLVEEWI